MGVERDQNTKDQTHLTDNNKEEDMNKSFPLLLAALCIVIAFTCAKTTVQKDKVTVRESADRALFNVKLTMPADVHVAVSPIGSHTTILSHHKKHGKSHKIELNHLKPGTTYNYSVFAKCKMNTLKVVNFGTFTTPEY